MLLIIFISISLIMSYLWLCYFLAGSILYLERQQIIGSPKDVALNFNKIEFKSSDGIELKGWYIPNESNKLIIMTHPGGFNRKGFEPALQGRPRLTSLKVDFLLTTKALHNAGYNILMFDFRNHGESDNDKDGITGVGLKEYKDVLGALNYTKENSQLNKMKIGFVSYCMGANATIIALSKEKKWQKKVKCVAAIQPVSMDVFIRSLIKAKYTILSKVALYPMVEKLVVWRGGYPLKEMSPKQYIKDLKIPIFYAQAEDDPWMDISEIKRFYKETDAKKELLLIEDIKERFDTYNYFGDKPGAIIDFLNKHMI